MSTIAESHLSNKDLAPTRPEQRTRGTYNLAGVFVAFALAAVTYVALARVQTLEPAPATAD